MAVLSHDTCHRRSVCSINYSNKRCEHSWHDQRPRSGSGRDTGDTDAGTMFGIKRRPRVGSGESYRQHWNGLVPVRDIQWRGIVTETSEQEVPRYKRFSSEKLQGGDKENGSSSGRQELHGRNGL